MYREVVPFQFIMWMTVRGAWESYTEHFNTAAAANHRNDRTHVESGSALETFLDQSPPDLWILSAFRWVKKPEESEEEWKTNPPDWAQLHQDWEKFLMTPRED